MFDLRLPSPMYEVTDKRLAAVDTRLWIKREDLIHPKMPGNKWRKLKYNLEAANKSGSHTLLTFGGAYSNHLRATAAAGSIFGFDTIGVVRGEEHSPLNWSLQFCVDHDMELIYLDRETYRCKTNAEFLETLRSRFNDPYVIPEGGSNKLAVRGCTEIAQEILSAFDYICCPVGTGGTLAGLAAGLKEGQCAVGFSALKGGGFLNDEVASLQSSTFGTVLENWRIELDYHFGGFAKRTPELDDFIREFESRHALALDWIYVAKMMAGIYSMAESGRFRGSTVVAIVTG